MEGAADKRTICWTAAAIYAGATLLGAVEDVLPGGQSLSVLPIIAAFVLCAATVLIGPRVPRNALAVLGPIGAAIIAYALATTHGYGDGAVLYMWPVLYMAYFFGARGTALIVAWIAVAHGIALAAMPDHQGNLDRWLDVVVSVLIVAMVVRALAARNERMVAQLTAEARIDPLTGVLNRRGLNERLATELARAARDRSPLAVVLLDLDHFKAINDRHGHEIGDRVLSWLGALLQEQVRGVDVVARAGGEEFVVLLPGQDQPSAHAFAQRVRAAMAPGASQRARARFRIPDELVLTLSAGVAAAVAPSDGQALIDAADQAMYEAKRAGRDQVVDADMTAHDVRIAA